jgi:hypothetical protein
VIPQESRPVPDGQTLPISNPMLDGCRRTAACTRAREHLLLTGATAASEYHDNFGPALR